VRGGDDVVELEDRIVRVRRLLLEDVEADDNGAELLGELALSLMAAGRFVE
jgi:hypothetical protein